MLTGCRFHTATAIHFPKFQSATSQPSQNEPMPRLNLSYVFRIPRARGFVTRSRKGARGRDAKQCGTLALATERPRFTLFPRPRIER